MNKYLWVRVDSAIVIEQEANFILLVGEEPEVRGRILWRVDDEMSKV